MQKEKLQSLRKSTTRKIFIISLRTATCLLASFAYNHELCDALDPGSVSNLILVYYFKK